MKRAHPPKPCNDCPFRREGGIRLYADRIREIVGDCAPKDHQGAHFICHKTVDYDERDLRSEQMCTGSLIFAYKLGRTTNLQRIYERIGLIDPKLADEDAWPEIFDDLDEMLATAIPARRTRRRKAR